MVSCIGTADRSPGLVALAQARGITTEPSYSRLGGGHPTELYNSDGKVIRIFNSRLLCFQQTFEIQ